MLVCRHPTDRTTKPADPKNFVAILKKKFFLFQKFLNSKPSSSLCRVVYSVHFRSYQCENVSAFSQFCQYKTCAIALAQAYTHKEQFTCVVDRTGNIKFIPLNHTGRNTSITNYTIILISIRNGHANAF